MDTQKKEWLTPDLKVLGDMATLTQQGRAKGQGSGDCLNTSQANQNTGSCAASDF